ncbi:hypothetical protein ARMGADRAFT_99975 [Armillaria gallica]|uniref:Uncharacterized protein n=1 Tax=Armillaria gallica TaxID=47427 RepID=A0A2H3CA20_ARMGA|nr:hypothetical protein ARMGADRAFT_99975 [Armillaria gallica]
MSELVCCLTSFNLSTYASSNLSSAVVIGTCRNMEGCNTHLFLADGNHSFLLSSRVCVRWERDSNVQSAPIPEGEIL